MQDENTDKKNELDQVLKAESANFRVISHIYTNQISLVRRTQSAVNTTIVQAKSSSSMLLNISSDPLAGLTLSKALVEKQMRVVDLIVLAAFGQKIEIKEFQDYAKSLVPLYASYDFAARLKESVLKNTELQKLEQEWLEGSDFTRVQQFFKDVTASIEAAAKYCGITIAPLPEF